MKGFTMLELVIVMAVIVILGLVTTISLQGEKGNTDLSDTTKQVGALLREAQSDSMSQEQDATWGVYFANTTTTAPFYALFINTYTASNTEGYYRLPATVGYVASSLASGATTSITFSPISGIASASTSIRLYLVAQSFQSSTIAVASSGAVSY